MCSNYQIFWFYILQKHIILLIKDRNNVNSSLIEKILIKLERNMKINFFEKINNNNGNMLTFFNEII